MASSLNTRIEVGFTENQAAPPGVTELGRATLVLAR